MTLPATYQTRTAATFSTNGPLYTKNDGEAKYLNLAAVLPITDTLSVASKFTQKNNQSFFAVKSSIAVPKVSTSQFSDENIEVTISVRCVQGATLSRSQIAARVLSVADYVVANVDNIIVAGV